MYYANNEEPEIFTFDEPLMGMDLIVALGFQNDKLDNLYAATFFKETQQGFYSKKVLKNMQEDIFDKVLDFDSFVYISQPRSVWFYSKEQYQFFMDLAIKLRLIFLWSTDDIYYFDEYAKEYGLNSTLVDIDDPAKNIAFNMMTVITKKMKR